MMSLYSFCLKTVISKNIKTSELPHTIQDDVTVLNRFKTKLHEWHRVLGYVEEKNMEIEAVECDMEALDLCLWGECLYHDCQEEQEEFENVIERLDHQKQDLEMLLGNCESDVVDARNDIENDITSKIDSKILRHLEHIYQY